MGSPTEGAAWEQKAKEKDWEITNDQRMFRGRRESKGACEEVIIEIVENSRDDTS